MIVRVLAAAALVVVVLPLEDDPQAAARTATRPTEPTTALFLQLDIFDLPVSPES
jgi:hypothetical protein